jgi:hypothetical protein
MPFSSVLGASTVIKPGVCTSTNRPASPYDGQVIYETDTDRAMVYNGTSWVVLSTGRTNPSGFDLLTSGSFTTSSGVSLPINTFTSTYVNYKLNINITANTSDSNPLLWRGRVSGTDNTTANYFYAARGSRYIDGAATTGGFGQSQTSARIGFMQNPLTSNTCQFEVFAPQLASNTSFLWRGTGRGVSDPDAVMEGGGYFAGTTQFDSLTFFPSAGTISGTYEVYGYAR